MGALDSIQHVVVLMLENRSFDHMLGFLYPNKRGPRNQDFEGLTGDEVNPDPNGAPARVFRITKDTPNAYLMPGADPGEGYRATNSQLFGTTNGPVEPPAPEDCNKGFVKDFAYTLGWELRERPTENVPGTKPSDIMGCFSPEMLPVLSGLARGFAVCDHWFAPAPTETLPNRAFACAATSQGRMDDHTKSYTVKSIFGALSAAGIDWAIHGYHQPPLTPKNFPDTVGADESHFGEFADFQEAARTGRLPAYTFLEPAWGGDSQNDQHPVSDVGAGEQYIHDVYTAVRNGPKWNETLLIITYDEHGGCYDHVAPPWTATPPDACVGEFGFDFRRFGIRVPAVLVSPWIAEGTVFRVPPSATPLDHTAILKTLEVRWNLAPLTERDKAACDLSGVLTLARPRTDDPLAGVSVPAPAAPNPRGQAPTHLQQVHAELASQLPVPDRSGGTHHVLPPLQTSVDYDNYIRERTAGWRIARGRRS